MTNNGVYIKAIKGNSEYADQVKTLGKANSSTLSLFPEGAFEQYIWKGNVLVAHVTQKSKKVSGTAIPSKTIAKP